MDCRWIVSDTHCSSSYQLSCFVYNNFRCGICNCIRHFGSFLALRVNGNGVDGNGCFIRIGWSCVSHCFAYWTTGNSGIICQTASLSPCIGKYLRNSFLYWRVLSGGLVECLHRRRHFHDDWNSIRTWITHSKIDFVYHVKLLFS